MWGFLKIFPMIGIAALVYAGIAYQYGADGVFDILGMYLADIEILGRSFGPFHVSDAFMLATFVLLFWETLKAREQVGEEEQVGAAMSNHLLSIVVLVGCLFALVMAPGFSTPTFIFISLAALFDVVAGLLITAASKEKQPDVILQRVPKSK